MKPTCRRRRPAPGLPTRPAAGFTLVELITVMGILGILMALIVGAMVGVSQQNSRSATEQILTALQSALQRYYEDWGAYPYSDTKYYIDSKGNSVTVMGEVLGAKGTAPLPPGAQAYSPACMKLDPFFEKEAILYAALNMRQRNGPYMVAGAGQTVEKRISLYAYQVYVDGWGRPILYREPAVGAALLVPVLKSSGADEFETADDITRP